METSNLQLKEKKIVYLFDSIASLFRFGRSCYLDTDGSPTCNCNDGYIGRRCDQCASGYSGNPLQPGDYCKQGTL